MDRLIKGGRVAPDNWQRLDPEDWLIAGEDGLVRDFPE